MKKSCFLFALVGAVLYSPLAFSSDIVNIGIKSKMSKHVLANCRFDSALALYINDFYPDDPSLTITNPGNSRIAGLRQTPDKLPDTYRASKVEFDDKGVMSLFGPNVKYSAANSSAYPARLFKDFTVTDVIDKIPFRYNYKVGMTLFSTLPAGINAATIYNKGEVNFAYRMADGQGQLECDIYDNAGKLLGLVDYVTDSGSGMYKTLAYGNNDDERRTNGQILSQFSLDAKIVRDYGGSYPRKRILLTMLDDRPAAQGSGANENPGGTEKAAAAAPARAVSAQYQSRVKNATDRYSFRSCTRNDTHGSWIDSPDPKVVIRPGGYFTFGMKSKGHGIQGEIRCAIDYLLKGPTEKEDKQVEMGRLLIEIDNDGTAFAVFPFISDSVTAKALFDGGFKYTLYVETTDDFSIEVHQ